MAEKLNVKLKEEISGLYTEMWNKCSLVYKDIGGYIPQWGNNYPEENDKGLLFFGKAPNLRLSQNPWKSKGVKEILDSIGVKNLSWLGKKDYECKGSAFIRVITKICKEFHKDSWYSHIGISNLYKIGSLTINSPVLINKQEIYARKIFVKELEVLSPGFVVMFSSKLEKSGFLKDFQNDDNETRSIKKVTWGNDYETKVYKIKNKIIITSPHPERKKEIEHAEIIVKLLREYGYYT